MNIAEQLEGSDLFKGVSLVDREALVKVMRQQPYPAGAVLFEKDAAGDSLYVILSGRIRVYTHDSQGNEFTIRYYGPSDIVGEFAILDQKPRSASAAAVEPSEVLILHRDDFLKFLQERPVVGLSMMKHLVDRVRYTTIYLQKVMDAVQQLSRGEYEQAIQNVSASGSDAEIQTMIEAFVRMVQEVQERHRTLQQSSGTE